MIGQLVELKTVNAKERFGILKGVRPDGRVRVTTSWYGISGGLGTERILPQSEIRLLTPSDIFSQKEDIQRYFETIWAVNNVRRATTKTVHFANTNPDGVSVAEIGFLPPNVSDRLVDHFLSEGWFAYDY